ncbi:hypothetical protein GCM10007162_19050 [Ignatzschineria ureiclastica]|uniref:MBL fold metallo-hydrolase n=1 Tax=Ignatzschineria ureiclastica TaxID=472582 RepID=UPI001300A9BF|nr:MBL fold metallo-hydrolase [Ignatzschineria ureiclastica]GHA02920.1 hypothetical protein GCM10007162_19050 [Ignatzschineria ureiclastica]
MFRYKNPHYNPDKPHHRLYGFENNPPTRLNQWEALQWLWRRRKEHLPKAPKEGYTQFYNEWCLPLTLPSEDHHYVTWLGHASIYLHTPDYGLLIDPVFSERASPFSFLGPKRKVAINWSISELPNLDYVLISHNHYDHLDLTTIREILFHFPLVTFIVPLGLERWFYKRGITRVIALDWFAQYEALSHHIVDLTGNQNSDNQDQEEHNRADQGKRATNDHVISDSANLKITAVPAQHWSKRGIWDRNRSLWCGYMLQFAGKTIYFSGDSGYGSQLLTIADYFPNIDLGFLPIGAYLPRDLMAPQHMNPQESVRLHQALNIRYSVGIHWGIFELTDESLDDPIESLKRSLQEAGLPLNAFEALKINQTILLTDEASSIIMKPQ